MTSPITPEESFELSHELLTPEEEAALARRMQSDDEATKREAKIELLSKNTRFLVRNGMKYVSQRMQKEDVFQETFLKLWKEIDGFNAAEGRFTTYADLIVQRHMNKAIPRHTELVYLPAWIQAILYKCSLVRTELQRLLKREPTYAEMLRRIDGDREHLSALNRAATAHSEIRAIPEEQQQVQELSEETSERREEQGIMREALYILHLQYPDYANIIRMLYGIEPFSQAMSVLEAAEVLGCTHQNVSQKHDKAKKILVDIIEQGMETMILP